MPACYRRPVASAKRSKRYAQCLAGSGLEYILLRDRMDAAHSRTSPSRTWKAKPQEPGWFCSKLLSRWFVCVQNCSLRKPRIPGSGPGRSDLTGRRRISPERQRQEVEPEELSGPGAQALVAGNPIRASGFRQGAQVGLRERWNCLRVDSEKVASAQELAFNWLLPRPKPGVA
jgi:hypothetical protein